MSKELEILVQYSVQRLGYRFTDPQLLLEATTHRSWVNEVPAGEPVVHNERLEFLGDAVLGLLVAEWLMEIHPEAPEGELTRWRSALVNEASLAGVARGLDLGEQLRLGRGEQLSGGREKDSLLADALEAVLGAVYLDGGLEASRRLTRHLLGEQLEELDVRSGIDAKSRLQQILQRRGATVPQYRVVATSGPDHRPVFTVEVEAGQQLLGRGSGGSKKEAEQAAAAAALEGLRSAGDGADSREP